MRLKPLTNNVIIKPIKLEKETDFGLVLPDTIEKDKPEQGEVVGIGEGRVLDNGQKIPSALKIGDLVVFKKYAPDEIKIDGEDYLIVNESEIIAIIEK